MSEVIEAANVKVQIENGTITAVNPPDNPTTRQPDHLLLPGFVSAHSHAFQRALRGRGETFPAGSGSFWSWREAMYELVTQLDAPRFEAAVRATFEEMRDAGITSVGEFHYLHHSPAGSDYAFDELVLRAARDAGIRITLLMTYYKTGGIGLPLAPAQKRFETRSVDEFFDRVDALREKLDPQTQQLGVAAHSIRGVPLDHLEPLYTQARARGMQVHMHVEEQRKEIEDCLAAYGRRPMQLLNERLPSCEGFTAVHATHTTPEDMEQFLARGGSVCITPLTEANLGDGIPDVAPLHAHPDRLSLGTDSNARISLIDEMRWLEYAQRLKSETRGVFRDEEGRNAPRLLHFATIGGARSLGINAGRIEVGAAADFVAVDAESLESLLFGRGDDAIVATCVAGVWKARPARR
ncbi:MAG TPA: formimidoylglutamate deiminase [Thermoanaerobaculia bacterium]|nr:formimidoylglutamate deiminase [Thermoanaerobaculia bacterium]